MVHLEAKKLGLRGLNENEVPKFLIIIKDNWLSLIPLILLVYLNIYFWHKQYDSINIYQILHRTKLMLI